MQRRPAARMQARWPARSQSTQAETLHDRGVTTFGPALDLVRAGREGVLPFGMIRGAWPHPCPRPTRNAGASPRSSEARTRLRTGGCVLELRPLQHLPMDARLRQIQRRHAPRAAREGKCAITISGGSHVANARHWPTSVKVSPRPRGRDRRVCVRRHPFGGLPIARHVAVLRQFRKQIAARGCRCVLVQPPDLEQAEPLRDRSAAAGAACEQRDLVLKN